MPIFEAQSDSGQSFQIDAPDALAASAIFKTYMAANPEPENSLAGSGKALASGIGEGVAGVLGLPGDMAELGARGIDRATQFIGGKLGVDVTPRQDKPATYGYEDIKKGMEGVTGKFYEPQTTTEKTISTVGSFLPAAIGGPGSLASRVATRSVISGVASEAAGQLAEGSGYEPVARIAGALGGAVAGGRMASSLNKPTLAARPTAAELETAKSAGYTHPEVAKLEINAQSPAKLADDIKAGLSRGTITEGQGPIPRFLAQNAYKAIDTLKEPQFGPPGMHGYSKKVPVTTLELPPAGSEISAEAYKKIIAQEAPIKTAKIADIDGTRKLLGTIAGEVGPTGRATPDALAATRAIKAIDLYVSKIPKADVVAGDAVAAGKILNEARANAAANFRSERVTQALEKAKNTATATHSGGNLENEIYKQVRTMLNNPKKHLRGWTAEEKAALQSVLPGKGASVLRRAGKLMGGGGGLGQLISGGAGGAMFGWPGMMAVPAAGMAANKIGSALATKRIEKVADLLRGRSPLYGAENQAALQKSLQRGGLFSSLPRSDRLALQGLLAVRSQPTNQ